jgi:hypothetical protein
MGTREEQFMSYAPEHQDTGKKRWFHKKRLWLLVAIVLFLGVGMAVFNYDAWLNLLGDGGGTIDIKAVPGTRIYIGDKLVGHDAVSFTYYELFRNKTRKPLPIEVTNSEVIELAEFLGPGAEILNSESMGGVGSALLATSGKDLFTRRSDGSLDQVFVFILDWTPPNEPARRFLLPVRLRQGEGRSSSFFTQAETGVTATRNPAYLRALGRPDQSSKTTFDFVVSPPPPKFAKEIQTDGLWEPTREN